MDSHTPLTKNNSNHLKNRVFTVSPTVNSGLDKESQKTDFNREDNSSFDMGCYGKIWRVTHKRTGKIYAIKVLHKERVNKKNLHEEINKVLDSLYTLEHINFLRLLNHFEDEENLYLIVQNVNKVSLYDQMKELEDKKVIGYMKQVINALIYLHGRNVFNRDFKSENIFVDDLERVKITDYGWSDINNNSSETIRSSFVEKNSNKKGLTFYTPPEVIENETITNKVDVWTLGVLLFELLTKGRTPFIGNSFQELKSNILELKINWGDFTSEHAKNLIKSMLRRNPEERITLNEILKNALFSQVQIPNYSPDEKIDPEESHINRRLTQNFLSPQDQLILKLKKENEILKKENDNYRKCYLQLEKDFNDLKTRNQCNTSTMDISTTEGGQEDSFLYFDNKMKFDYVNKDRLSKLSELEEKSSEILEFRSKIRMLENEIELINLNFDEAKENNIFYEKEVKKLSGLLEQEKNEKETKITLLNKKLEMLENKLFNPRSSFSNVSSPEESIQNISFLLFDLVKEFNEAVQKLLLRSKDENENLMRNLTEVLTSRETGIRDTLYKVKEGIESEILRKSNKSLDSSRSTMNDKMDWMKKQISELIPFKLKSLNLEESLYRCEKELRILTEKLNLVEIEKYTIKGLLKQNEETLTDIKKYVTSIENKLSDTKDFIMKNFPDKIEDFFLIYKI